MKKVVLAFSGGIGTTACLDLLRRRYQAEVVTFTANIGQHASSEDLSDHALDLGARRALVGDLRDRFARQFVWPVVRAGAVYDSGYALSSALARPLIVAEVVRVAREVGATAIAHGIADQKSNDQLRFETSAAALAPELEVLAPLRDAKLMRLQEIEDYLRHRGLAAQSSKDSFTITENLWGTTFHWTRALESWEPIPERRFRVTVDPTEAPDTPEELLLGFERGVPVSINGQAFSPVELLERLSHIAGRHGIGRVFTFEDRLIGIKTREVYEQPAAKVIHTAKEVLERLVLSRDILRLKPQQSRRYAQLVYDGFWYSELRQAFDAFFASMVEHVNGEVRLRLYKGQAQALGARSKSSLYSLSQASSEKTQDAFDYASLTGHVRTVSAPLKRQTERQHPLWSQELL
jgi:argininosuccinate synthase